MDVHARTNREKGRPRPSGIFQWTLSSAPYHPIFPDAVMRVVNSTRVVEEWEAWRAQEIQRITEQESRGWEKEVKKLSKLGRLEAMSVMEWTGTALFTDSFLA